MKKLLLIFCLVFLSAFVSAQCTFYLLDVGSYSTLPAKIFAGDTVSLNVGIKNTSDTCSAQNVLAALSLNESYFEPLNLSDNVSLVNSQEIKSAVFSFKVKGNAPPGSYKFPLKLQYLNLGNSVEKTFDLVLDVKECYSLDIDEISYSSPSVYAGETLGIFAKVKNSCSGPARDVSVQLKPVTNSSFDPFIVLSSNFLQVGNIGPNQSKSVSFSLRPISDAVPQIYVFRLDANCLDCDKVFSDTFSFEVLAKPDLIFSGIDFSNESRPDAKDILAGETFSFSVQLDNIGKEVAKAVRVDLVTSAQIVGAKQNFIGNIDPDDSGSAVFDLSVLPQAAAGDYKSTIVVEFLNEKGGVQKVSQDYSFYVSSAPSNIFGLIFLLILVIIVLVILYFFVKMVFRQLAMQKSKLR